MNVPSNEYAEFNMFLDPLAAKRVLESKLNITLIPLSVQSKVNTFPKIIERLRLKKKTPEALFVRRVLSRLHRLQKMHHRYQHTVSTLLFIVLKSFRTNIVSLASEAFSFVQHCVVYLD